MEGTLHKTEQGWIVRYFDTEKAYDIMYCGEFIPIHPDYVKYYFLDDDAVGAEVKFEIVEVFNKNEQVGYKYINYAKLINVDKLGNEDVRKLGYDVREHEILKEMRTMSAKHGFEEHSFFTRETQNQKRLSFYFGARWGYDKAKETLYTEEQVIAIVEKSRATGLTAEYIMLSLKQPKQ